MILTPEQELARLLVVALHRLGGSLEVTHELLEHMGPYQLVWNNNEDLAYLTVSIKSGDILIASVDGDNVEVVL